MSFGSFFSWKIYSSSIKNRLKSLWSLRLSSLFAESSIIPNEFQTTPLWNLPIPLSRPAGFQQASLYSNKKLVGASDHSEGENQGQGRPVTPKRAIFLARCAKRGYWRKTHTGRWSLAARNAPVFCFAKNQPKKSPRAKKITELQRKQTIFE